MNNKDCWILLENEGFVRWVLHPDAASDRYWKGWIRQDAQRAALVKQAKELLHQLQQSPTKSGKEALTRNIWNHIQAEMQPTAATPLPMTRRSYRGWAVAASLVILVSAGSVFLYTHRTPVAPPAHLQANNESAIKGNTVIACQNQTTATQKIYLVDGSVVTLEPGSAISYAQFLGKKTREVILRGNAFFDIAPDANRPFLVRSGDLVTRVLGTSFRVNTRAGAGDIQVAVRTGKVSIYKADEFDKGHEAFCVLLPHQEAVFHKREQNLAFQSNADAQLLIPPPETVPMNFDDAPVTTILDQMGKMYHIHIQYNRDSLQQCRLTTSLQEEKLSDKMDIICKAINASYRTLDDDTIIIDGGHCP